MSRLPCVTPVLASVVAICAITPPILAEPVPPEAAATAISLDYADAPRATVEVSLSFGLFSDLFGVSDAALQGIVDAAARFGVDADPAEGAAVELTAKQVAVAQQVIGIVKGSIKNLELRVYEDVEADSSAMRAYYSNQLAEAGWDRVVRVTDKDEHVEVSLRRDSGGIRGAFVMASEGSDELVVALLDCDLSPQRVQQLTDSLTTAALDLGLGKQLQHGIEEMKRELARKSK